MLANHPNVLGGGATTSSSSGGTGLFADGTAAAPSISFANDSDTGFYSQTPNQIALAFGGQYRGYFGVTSNDFIVRSSVSDAQLTLGSAGNVAIQAALTNQNITLTPSGTGVVQIGSASGTLLLVGTSTNSNNGAIQLATHTSSAGGIGFGTDTSLYRGGSSVLTLGSTGLSQFLFFQQNSTRSGYIQSAPSSLDLVCDTGEIKLKSNAAVALTLDTSQNATFAGAVKTSSTTLSGAGAIPITTSLVKYTSTGALQALTLANGVDGQRLTIVHDVDGGSGVLTPTTKTGFSTVTFTSAGDTVTLVYVTTRGWMVTGSYLATIAP